MTRFRVIFEFRPDLGQIDPDLGQNGWFWVVFGGPGRGPGNEHFWPRVFLYTLVHSRDPVSVSGPRFGSFCPKTGHFELPEAKTGSRTRFRVIFIILTDRGRFWVVLPQNGSKTGQKWVFLEVENFLCTQSALL